MGFCRWTVHAFVICVVLIAFTGTVMGQADIAQVSLLATNSIDLGSKSDILSGDVVVNAPSLGPTLSSGKELVVSSKATTHITVSLKADSMELKSKADVRGDVYYNDIQVHNKANIDGAQITPLSLPVFNILPLFLTETPGTVDIVVPKDESITLTPGAYGDISLGKASNIRFTGGSYSIRSIDAKRLSELLFEAPAVIQVETTIKSVNNFYIGKANGFEVPPSLIVFHVAGINGNSGGIDETPPAVQIGTDSEIFANFYVPNGTFRFKSGTIATGAFIARNIDVGNGCQISLDSGFTITNVPPLAQDDTFEVGQGQIYDSSAHNCSLLDNDTDYNAGDSLSVSLSPSLRPLYGSVVLNPDGTFVYSHDGSDAVSDSFIYEVCDNGTPQGCSEAAVTVTITGIPGNHLPRADSQALNTLGGGSVQITLTGSDPDQDDLTFSITDDPTEGTVSIPVPIIPASIGRCSISRELCNDFGTPSTCSDVNDICMEQPALPVTSATVSYTPNTVNNLADSFEFQVDDGISGTDAALVMINREDVPEEPVPPPTTVVALDTDNEMLQDTSLTVKLTADAPQDVSLTFSLVDVSGPANGSLVDLIQGDVPTRSATVTYTPNQGYLGEDQFDFEVCGIIDQVEVCDVATITIDIIAPAFESPPLAEDQELMTFVNDPVEIILKGTSGGTLIAKALDDPQFIDIGVSVAGISADSNQDGHGDDHDNLPGPMPLRIAAGVGYYADGYAQDPVGDAGPDPDPDIVSAAAHSDGRVLFLEVRYAPGTFDQQLTRAQVLLDMDNNPNTGHQGSDSVCDFDYGIIGAEYLVNMGGDLGNVAQILAYAGQCNFFDPGGSGTVTFHSDGMNAALPLTLIGDDDGSFWFKVTISEEIPGSGGHTGVLDYMPDVGTDAAQTSHTSNGTNQFGEPLFNSTARIHIEFPLAEVPPDFTDATVVFNTYRGQFDSLDTDFHVVGSEGNGILENSDFQSAITMNPVALMSVPVDDPNYPIGTMGEFSFNVTPSVKELLALEKNFLSIQGRSKRDSAPEIYGYARGLQILSSAEGNLFPEWSAPILRITPSGVGYTIISLPLNGTLLDAAGAPVIQTPHVVSGSPVLTFVPDPGFTGTSQFNFEVTDGVQTAVAAIVLNVVHCDCNIYKQCCNSGR